MTFQSDAFGSWGNPRNQDWVNRMKERYQLLRGTSNI